MKVQKKFILWCNLKPKFSYTQVTFVFHSLEDFYIVHDHIDTSSFSTWNVGSMSGK